MSLCHVVTALRFFRVPTLPQLLFLFKKDGKILFGLQSKHRSLKYRDHHKSAITTNTKHKIKTARKITLKNIVPCIRVHVQ